MHKHSDRLSSIAGEDNPETPAIDGPDSDNSVQKTGHRRYNLRGDNKGKVTNMTNEVKNAIEAGYIAIDRQSKTQKTRGKGSRELTYEWDNVDFKDIQGALAYFSGRKRTLVETVAEDGNPVEKKTVVDVSPEDAILDALSDYASDQNQQEAWEALFELSDTDKQIRAAAKKLVGLLPGVDTIEKAEEFVRAQIEAAAK